MMRRMGRRRVEDDVMSMPTVDLFSCLVAAFLIGHVPAVSSKFLNRGVFQISCCLVGLFEHKLVRSVCKNCITCHFT